MYPYFHELLADRRGGPVFTCFGPWHFFWIALTATVAAVLILRLRKRPPETRQKLPRRLIALAFGLYILDFFLMPRAYGEIDIEKLPFHACTAMCVMCFLCHHNRFLEKFKVQFAILGLASNLIYVIYPAGVGWYQIHPLSYRVIQTLLFHGIMTAHGLMVLAFDEVELKWKTCWKELIATVAMTLWALLGNTLYNGSAGSYSHHFNWFFVTQDPFWLLPETVAPYVMPPVIVVVMFAAVLLTYAGYFTVKKLMKRT